MTHWKKLTNPNYIGSYSLEGKDELEITIEKVVQESVKGSDGKADDCIVAYLKDEKPFILNKTNCRSIEKVLGTPNIEEWAGKSITIYLAKVRAFGETMDALRVRETTPKKPDLNPKSDKWSSALKALESGNTTIAEIKKFYQLTKENEKLLCKNLK